MTAQSEPRARQRELCSSAPPGSAHHISTAGIFCSSQTPHTPLCPGKAAFASLTGRAGRSRGVPAPSPRTLGCCGMHSLPLPCSAQRAGTTQAQHRVSHKAPIRHWFRLRAAEHRLFLSVFHKYQNTLCPINSFSYFQKLQLLHPAALNWISERFSADISGTCMFFIQGLQNSLWRFVTSQLYFRRAFPIIILQLGKSRQRNL